MLLNRFEYALMNNPVRALIQRHFEAPRLLNMGGPMRGGAALEVGCGRGVGTQLIFDLFGAGTVDAFDLDPRMVALARARLVHYGARTRLWVGDAASIAVPDSTYDAVFDFGIIHHIPRWRRALTEIHRVLKPGGRFYAEEVLGPFIRHAVSRRLFDHPEADRFDAATFRDALARAGLVPGAPRELWHSFAWFVATKPVAPGQGGPAGDALGDGTGSPTPSADASSRSSRLARATW
jgi:ubiquinone/menaquinone biosynthesis C-methylase UbiE